MAMLNGQALPRLAGYQEKRSFRGAVIEMADGSTAFDLVQENAKRIFILEWKVLTSVEKGLIETLLSTMKTGVVKFLPPTGESEIDVTRTAREIDFVAVSTANGLRWAATLELREV